MRLYSDFYESDIIVASPLALATKLSEDEEEGEQHCICICKFLLRATVRICLFVSNHVGPCLLSEVNNGRLYTGLGVCISSTLLLRVLVFGLAAQPGLAWSSYAFMCSHVTLGFTKHLSSMGTPKQLGLCPVMLAWQHVMAASPSWFRQAP